MSISTDFTPNQGTAPGTNPKDWAYEMGILPQSHSIVFTKAQLISFLKTKGIEVGPNFTELNRLPSYATVGKFSNSLTGESPTAAAAPQAVRSEQAGRAVASKTAEREVVDASGQVFRPSRRVRQDVGGSSGQVRSLFSSNEDGPAPAPAPHRRALANEAAASQAVASSRDDQDDEVLTLKPAARSVQADEPQAVQNTFRPSRRVRVPGGTGGVSSFTLG